MDTQKRIIIIGAGITALRAALEIAQKSECHILILEKSKSVGGRVATRRFGDLSVNHGTENFNGLNRVLKTDPFAEKLIEDSFFLTRATDLPKKMRDELLLNFKSKVEFKFNWEVSKIEESDLKYDHMLITAPVPQAEKLTGVLVPGVEYHKSILFLGLREDKIQRIEMDHKWSEDNFELSDEEILRAAKLEELQVKKWRYARVKKGRNESFLEIKKNILLAGDAFDPDQEFNLGSSWLSGLFAGREILRRIHE